MEINFATQKMTDAANGEVNGTYSKMSQIIRKNLGRNTTCSFTEIVLVLDALAAAETCADLPPSLHPHPLKGDRVGHFVVDIKIPGQGGRGVARLVFQPNHRADELGYRIDNYKTIKKITIVELCVDYHTKGSKQ